MPKDKSVDEMTDDAIREGGYLAMVYFDLHATQAEAVKNLMVGFIGKLTREPGVIYAVGEIDQPIEKEGIFSTWAEVKLLASDFPTLVRIAAQYSPIGVEILRPDTVKMTLGEAQGALLDVSQTSQNFTRLIMERMLSDSEKKDYATKLSQRMALGKKLFEKKR
ncbi:MAG: hypothetical protein WCY41_01515 [Candidatus Micrarchaeia archaeon]